MSTSVVGITVVHDAPQVETFKEVQYGSPKFHCSTEQRKKKKTFQFEQQNILLYGKIYIYVLFYYFNTLVGRTIFISVQCTGMVMDALNGC